MRRKKTVKSESGRLVECIGVWASERERQYTRRGGGECVNTQEHCIKPMHCSERMRQQYIHVSTEGQKEEKDSAACNPVTQREIQRGGWALEVKTAALATVTADGLLCRAGARVCLRVSLSPSLACFSAAHLPLQSRCQPAASQSEQANCHNLLPQDKGK